MTTTREASILFRDGNPPEAAGWPGGDYSDETVGDLRIQRNVAVPMRDGLNLLVDLYQSAGTTAATPVLWPGRRTASTAPSTGPTGPGTRSTWNSLSPYTAFETPDPAYWAGQGYSVILADARGTWGSAGRRDHVRPRRRRGLLRPDRVGRHPGMEQRQGRHGGGLLVRGHPMGGRRTAAPAPGRDQPLGGLLRPVLRGSHPRRDPGDPVHPDAGSAHRQHPRPGRGRRRQRDEPPLLRRLLEGKDRRPVRHRRAGLRRRQLDRPRAAHPRHARGLPEDGVDAEVAGDPRPQEVGVLLRQGQRRPTDGVLRPLPQERAQRGRPVAPRADRGPRTRPTSDPSATSTSGPWPGPNTCPSTSMRAAAHSTTNRRRQKER